MRSIFTPAWLALACLTITAAGPASPPEITPKISVREVRSVDGHLCPLVPPTGGATAVVFYSTECPISNTYSPTLVALANALGPQGLNVVGICVDADLKPAEVAHHAAEFGLKFPVAIDRDGSITARLGARVTPEALVIDSEGNVRYRGRIDDQHAARGKRNATPRTAELREAAEAVLAGRPVANSRVEAVGCPVPERPDIKPIPTYSQDVAAILQNNCQQCHRPGQVGPFPLETFAQARKRASDIGSVTAERHMPPWKAAPGVGPAFKHSKALTDDEIMTLTAWADAGAPEGNPADTPPNPTFSTDWTLGEPDLVLEMPEEFSIPAGGEDIYRCFVIPTSLPDDKYISAIEYRPGNRKVVHHVIGYVETNGKAREKDAAEPGPGYTCFGGPQVKTQSDLGGWAPGAEPAFLPEGVGRKLASKADVVMQVHYHPSGKPETDRTRVGIYFARKPIKQTLHWNLAGDFGLYLPAGAKEIPSRSEWEVPVDVTALGVLPHMHLLGKDMTMSVKFPDGHTQDLIRINDWDFNWQHTYYFEKPVDLPKGSVVRVVAHFDNSADNPRNPRKPPVPVKWGEATTDEMSIGFIGVVKKGQDLTRPGEADDLYDIFERQGEERRKQMEEYQKKAQEQARKKAEAAGGK